MPSFTSQIPNLKQVGPVCTIKIGLSRAASDVLISQGGTLKPPVGVTALIDTGASGTCIKPEIVSQFGLISRGIAQIATPSSKAHPCNVYDVSIQFPNGVAVPTVPVIETPLEGQSIQCLIGRDILEFGILIYSGYTQTFSLSF